MPDLQPIKDRRENAGLEYGTFIAAAPDDISALITEVERLRGAIEAHREQSRKTYKVAQAWWDEDLWAVLE